MRSIIRHTLIETKVGKGLNAINFQTDNFCFKDNYLTFFPVMFRELPGRYRIPVYQEEKKSHATKYIVKEFYFVYDTSYWS